MFRDDDIVGLEFMFASYLEDRTWVVEFRCQLIAACAHCRLRERKGLSRVDLRRSREDWPSHEERMRNKRQKTPRQRHNTTEESTHKEMRQEEKCDDDNDKTRPSRYPGGYLDITEKQKKHMFRVGRYGSPCFDGSV